MDKGRVAENLLRFAFTRERANEIVGDLLERSSSALRFWSAIGSVLLSRSWRWVLGWLVAMEVSPKWQSALIAVWSHNFEYIE